MKVEKFKVLLYLKKSGLDKSGKTPIITFADITEEFGESFKIFMKITGERKSAYINKCITWLNRLIYIAIDQDVLISNPIEDVKYEKKEPAKTPIHK